MLRVLLLLRLPFLYYLVLSYRTLWHFIFFFGTFRCNFGVIKILKGSQFWGGNFGEYKIMGGSKFWGTQNFWGQTFGR